MMALRLAPLHQAGLKTEPMSREQTEMFVRFNMAERDSAPIPFAALSGHFGREACRVPQMAILLGRLEVAAGYAPELRITPEVLLFVAQLSDSPGGLVCWAYMLVELAREKPVDFWAFARAFPVGYPTEDAMIGYWDAQKTVPGCHLDQAATWMPAEVDHG